MRKKENSGVGRAIRDRMGFSANDKVTSPKENREVDFEEKKERTLKTEIIQEKKKSVRIVDGKENIFGKDT